MLALRAQESIQLKLPQVLPPRGLAELLLLVAEEDVVAEGVSGIFEGDDNLSAARHLPEVQLHLPACLWLLRAIFGFPLGDPWGRLR